MRVASLNSGRPDSPPASRARSRSRKDGRPRDRGVAHDHAVDAGLARDADHVVEIGEREIRRDLEQHRQRADARACLFAHGHDARQQIVERARFLQVAQAGGIGRGDVDGEVARHRREHFHQPRIVAGAVGRIAVGPDIDADDAAFMGARGEPRKHGGGALVIEAEAVDHALVGVETKQARPRVADLRARGDGADLDETKAEAQQRVRRLGILVEAGRDPDRIGKIEPEGTHGKLGRIGRPAPARHEAQRLEREPMGVLGVEGAHQRPGQAVE